MMGPIVYIITLGVEVLYIGSSRHGLSRPLNQKHHVLSKKLTKDMAVEVHFYNSWNEAVSAETFLINNLRPIWNGIIIRRKENRSNELLSNPEIEQKIADIQAFVDKFNKEQR